MAETTYTETRTGLLVPATGTATATGTTQATGTGTDRTAGTRSKSSSAAETETGTTRTGTGGTDPDHAESDTPSQSRSTPAGTGTRRDRAGAWLSGGGYLILLTGVVAVVASIGQKLFAEKEQFVGHIEIAGWDATPWFTPFVFDLAVATFLHGGIRVARRAAMRRKQHQPAAGGSPWPWWAAAAAIGGLSIYTNTLHVGAMITASASVVLLLGWFLTLHSEYLELTADLRSKAKPKLLWSKLTLIDRDLAKRAWIIAETRPMDLGVAHRKLMGEEIGQRDLAILCARLYRDVLADQLYKMLTNGIEKNDGRIRAWHVSRRREAARRAVMTAEDAVDQFLGRPVIERQGIKIATVTYAATADTRVTAPAAPPATPAPTALLSPAEAALNAPTAAMPMITVPSVGAEQPADAPAPPAPVRAVTDYATVVATIEGLPEIDPSRMCGCHRNGVGKECGWTLIEHIARKADQVKMVLAAHENWATRTERISKSDVFAATGNKGSSVQNQVAWIFDSLRDIAAEQQEPAAH